ncbi:MAG: HlyC/CorC family transporter [Candidatus Eiseniibacteriota bacterium]|nr:MAG: HlyC/CorC family transporter [Candidatus Eisenbacteria bacterium]
MTPSTVLGLSVVAVCVFLSAFFSGAETGVVSVNRIRLRHHIRSGDRRAEHLSKLLVRQEGVLVATLIGTNVFNVTAAAIGTVLLTRSFESAAPVVSTVLVTPLLLLFGEVMPKAYFRFRADTAMLTVSRPLAAATSFLAPFARMATWFANLVFRITRTTRKSPFVTREELKSIVRESAERGALRSKERDMLHGVLDFGSTTVKEVMIPLRDVASVDEEVGVEELKSVVRDKGHTRVLVHRERVDEVVGFVNVFDVLYAGDGGQKVPDFLRSIRAVPETKRLDGLLIEMLKGRAPIALVVDELGTCSGIVTVEDIIEEIMGELIDEHEAVSEEIQQTGEAEYLIDARMDIDEFNERFGLELPKEGYETIGGFILAALDKLPQEGETLELERVVFEVVDVHRYGITKIKMTLTDV